jgi:hypothetical protein
MGTGKRRGTRRLRPFVIEGRARTCIPSLEASLSGQLDIGVRSGLCRVFAVRNEVFLKPIPTTGVPVERLRLVFIE